MENKNSLWWSTKCLIAQIINGEKDVVIEAARQSGLTTALLDYDTHAGKPTTKVVG